MQEATAKALADLIVRQNVEQLNFLKEVETKNPVEFIELQKILANTLGTNYIEVLQPIFAKYPEIKPDNYP